MNAKAPAPGAAVPSEELADLRAVADAVAAGRPVDPEVARRVRDRSDRARKELLAARGVQDISVQLIRESRGPLDAEQERELTLAQRDLLRRGELRLTDPDTGKTYVLVPEDEYDRLHSAGR
ncbi:MAG: hypothetical protein J2P46_18720 [Zavarzinella sp.]|nr:hypothetical protein [Zavarzinella sp.]